MEVFLASQERGAARHEVVSSHPELAELLNLLFDGETEAAVDDEAQAFGDYRITREIGRGGMGVVYEASQRSLGRRVALKVLGLGVTVSPTQVARFRREALVLARLDHPHVVRVLDVGETAGRHWLAMDLVEGQSLDRRLAALRADGGHRGASLRDLVQAIAAIADALQHVHDQGILHRDVKPANILLRRDGHALLSDFGLARDDFAPTMTQVGVIAGTPHYMSPEHLVGGTSLGPISDVFSLGAALYECITLQRPFEGGSNDAVLRQILQHDPPDPRRLHRGLHADLAAISLKAIEKESRRRYHTAAAFAADLHAFLDLRPVQARTPSTLQRLQRWSRREPWRAALASVLLVAAAAGVYVVVQWPELQAAAQARANQDFEDALSLGWLERTSGRRAECLAAFQRALATRPQSAEATAGLCLATRQFDGAEVAFAELDRRAPVADDPDLMQRARMLMLQGAGRAKESDALRNSLPPPRTATGLWFTGTATFLAAPQDPAAMRTALEMISLAVRLSPTPRFTLLVQWAIVAYTAKDLDAMRECRQMLMQLWPEHAYALHYSALTLAKTDPLQAIELCRKARANGMKPADSFWLEFSMLAANDPNGELIPTIRQALQFPWDDARRGTLIEQLFVHGGEVEAAAAVEDWYRTSPDNVEARLRMGQLRCRQGDQDGAIDLLAAVAAARPDDGDALYSLAIAQHAGERDDDTRKTLARVLTLLPDDERPHMRLLDLLVDHQEAAAILAEHRRWATARPQDAKAHLALAKALLAQQPAAPVEALVAIHQADYLAVGKDAEILDIKAAAHEALGEPGPAERWRIAAQALRAAAPLPKPAK